MLSAWSLPSPMTVGSTRMSLPDLQAIDELFSDMSGSHNADRWSLDALADDPGWVTVQGTARRVLVRLVGE